MSAFSAPFLLFLPPSGLAQDPAEAPPRTLVPHRRPRRSPLPAMPWTCTHEAAWMSILDPLCFRAHDSCTPSYHCQTIADKVCPALPAMCKRLNVRRVIGMTEQ
ncbi:hypothetical protein B0H15DRAFT_948894 [Mycena belliarum]|uniref:Uncharacterized protein n=1 Tax=Mycena belliarum TaxID=1033014 RepID=A0AAD6XN76_9AGAR|nr:hypothetical protein B0H15DRAFT_955025 [Mycena belliae]KAJ7090406.1 hypothetical protein B0H15DRAFT_948894 [Mycena belliae]